MRLRQRDIIPPAPDIRYALISSTGVIQYGSGGLSVVRTGTGSYTINFNPAYKPFIPMVFISAYGGLQYVSVISQTTYSFCTVAWANSPGGAGVDSAFNFLAIAQPQ